MEFASEMVIKATFAKLRTAEVPITLHKDGRSRRSHLRSWRDGWRHLRFMLLHCPLWLFCIPALTLFVSGAGFGARLLVGPIQIGGIGFDTNTLLVCAMSILLGSQLGFFGIFARCFATLAGILPPSRRLEKLLSRFSLEMGLVVGAGLMTLGFCILVTALLFWRRAGYGAISYPDSLRMVVPAVTSLTVGVQAFFASFFLDLLTIPSADARNA